MRFCFILCYILFATGSCIYVFRKFEINYLHIFQLDYKYKIQQHQLWKSSIILFFIWAIGFTVNFIYLVKQSKDNKQEDISFVVPITLACFFLIVCFQPCVPVFYRTARMEVVKCLIQIVIAPCGTVRFRDFFLADVITSMATPLADIGLIVILIQDRIEAEKSSIAVYFTTMAFLPYWWRFWQCINKWYNLGNKLQMVNAMKYFSKFLSPIAILLGSGKTVDEKWYAFMVT